jgi:hypothetical protein
MSVSVPGAAVALPRARWVVALEGVNRPRLAMTLWGSVAGLVTALVLLKLAPHEWPIMESRATGMRDSLAVLAEGGPLLVGRHSAHGSYYPIALGDDPGAFTYFPWLAHLFGGVDPVVILTYFYVAVVAALAAVYPIVFHRLTGSLLAGLAAPIMLVACLLSMGFDDIYWIPAWGVMVVLPIIFLLVKHWPRGGLFTLLGVSLFAGWLSSIRSSSGLGLLAIAALVVLMRRWRWWRVLAALAVLALAYLSTSTLDIAAIRAQRDHQLGVRAMLDDQMTQHPLFHTAYIGLGYLSNGYGIRFKDEVAAERVHRESPRTPYMSHRYETLIRSAYFGFVKAHPLEALRQYAAKALVELADTGPYLLLVLLTLPAMLLLGSGRRLWRRLALISMPSLVIGFAQPIVALPGQGYDTELLATLGVLGILGICWALGRAEARARARGSLSLSASELRAAWSAHAAHPGSAGRAIRISTVTVTVLVLVCTGGYFVRQAAFRWQGTHVSALLRDLGYTPGDDV